MKLENHIEFITYICKIFTWKTNRLRQFQRASKLSREIEANLNLELLKLNITRI